MQCDRFKFPVINLSYSGNQREPRNIYRGHLSQACAHQARCCLHRWWLSLIIFVSVCGWTFMCELCKSGEGLVFISQGRGEGMLCNPPDLLRRSSRKTSAHCDQDDLQMTRCRHCSFLPGGKQPLLLHFSLMSSFSKQAINQFKCESTVL